MTRLSKPEARRKLMRKGYKKTHVIERYKDPKTGVPKERLACGHVRTDPAFHYSNQTSFRIKRAYEALDPKAKIVAHCARCSNLPVRAPAPA